MSVGSCEDGGDDAADVFAGDGGVAGVTERQYEPVVVPDLFCEIDDPFMKEGRSEMGYGHPGMVEEAFGYPMVLRTVAFYISSYCALGHVYDEADLFFEGGLCEIGCCFEDTRYGNGVDKIGF